MPRCCRAGAARRRSSARCSPATAKPASRSCRWTPGSTPGRCCCSDAFAIAATTTRARCTTGSPRSARELIVDALAELAARRARATPQPAAGVTYARKIDKQRSAARLDAARGRARARGARVPTRAGRRARCCDGEPLKIWRARVVDGSGAPGTVLRAERELVVGCGEGALRIVELQRAGGKRLAAAEFLRGHPPARPARASDERARAGAGAARRGARGRARRRAARALPTSSSASPRKRSDTPRAALLDLTHGTLRRYGRVQAIVAELSRRGAPDRAGRGAAVVLAVRARIRALRAITPSSTRRCAPARCSSAGAPRAT